jgi:hypothetical protein
VAAEEVLAQRQRVGLFQDFPNSEKVSQRLGHFCLVNIEKSVVNPVGASGRPKARSD